MDFKFCIHNVLQLENHKINSNHKNDIGLHRSTDVENIQRRSAFSSTEHQLSKKTSRGGGGGSALLETRRGLGTPAPSQEVAFSVVCLKVMDVIANCEQWAMSKFRSAKRLSNKQPKAGEG